MAPSLAWSESVPRRTGVCVTETMGIRVKDNIILGTLATVFVLGVLVGWLVLWADSA